MAFYEKAYLPDSTAQCSKDHIYDQYTKESPGRTAKTEHEPGD
jgi:hypothetical protein